MSLFKKILLGAAVVNIIGATLNMFAMIFDVVGLAIAGAVLCGIALITVTGCLIYTLK